MEVFGRGAEAEGSLVIMVFTQVLLLQLLLASLVSASHHMGVSSTYTYRGRNPDGTFKVDFHFRDAYDNCISQHNWSFYGGQCGSSVRSQRGVIDQSTNAPSYESRWFQSETLRTRNVPSDKPFLLREASCCWVFTRNRVSNWTALTYVDLGTRSDTREPNRSPDIAILLFLRVPENCPRTYKITTFDPDGDKVRCRYGKIRNEECSTCDQPSGFHLDQDSCTLQYNSASSDPIIYGFEMVVEDFPKQRITLNYSDGSWTSKFPAVKSTTTTATTTTRPTTTMAQLTKTKPRPTTTTAWPPAKRRKRAAPTTTTAALTTTTWHPARTYRPRTTTTTSNPPPSLSKLPLQFSFLVDPPAPSCQPGLYIPQYLPPTPRNGAHVQAEVNKEMKIRVKAKTANSVIDNIILSGPQNMTKTKTTHNEFVITWTPTSDHLGNHYVICFVVESKSGSRVYQSDMRCVVVDVRLKIGFTSCSGVSHLLPDCFSPTVSHSPSLPLDFPSVVAGMLHTQLFFLGVLVYS